jgi:hypothetical protein
VKHLSCYSLAIVCLVIIPTDHLFAQTTVGIETEDSPSTNLVKEKVFMPEAKTLLHFQKENPAAENIRWSKIREGSQVSFICENKNWIVRYSPKGRWISTMRYLSVDQLPQDIVSDVLNTYKGYHIFFAQDVRTYLGYAHVIKIEDCSSWKTLKIVNGEIEVMEEYIKS